MKKSKRILSAITALALSASAFASMVIPASAADDGATLYSQDYEATGATADWSTSVEGRYTPILLTDSTIGINKYLTVNQGERSNNGAVVSSPNIDVEASRFAVEFDMKLGSSADSFASFDLQDSAGNVFFSLKQTAKNGTTWRINDNSDYDLVMPKAGNVRAGDETDIAALGWYHFIVQYADGMMYVTAKDKVEDTYVKYNGNADVNQALVPPASQNGGIKKMVFNTAKTTADFAIDNVVVRNLRTNEVAEDKFYNLSVKTNRYAKMVYTRSDKSEEGEKTIYADANGNIDILLLAENSTVTYTLSKTGYTAPDTAVNATVTMTEEKTVNATLTPNEDTAGYLYYESDFGNAAGNISVGREADVALGNIELPDIAEISFDLNVTAQEQSHVTMAFFNADSSGIANKNDVFGIQGNADGVFLFSDYNGTSSSTVQQGWQQYDAVGKFDNSVKIADSYVGETKVKLVVDKNQKTVTATFGDNAPQVLSFTKDADVIKYIKLAKHNEAATATIDNLIVSEPDPTYVLVTGDTAFAKIAGKTVTRQYTATPALYVEGEEFAWTAVDSTTNQAVTGITIDDNGLLSVEDTATVPTTLKITATSKTTNAKKGEITATVNNYADLTPTIEGPKAVEVGNDATYKVTKIIDQYDDDVTEYYTPVWTIDGKNTDTSVTFTNVTPGKAIAVTAQYDDTALESVFTEEVTIPSNGTLEYSTTPGAKVMLWKYPLSSIEPLSSEVKETHATGLIEEGTVATIGGKSGELAALEAGNVTLTVTLADGQTATYPVKVDKYYDIVDYEEQSTVDVENLVEDAAITGYLVTLSDADDVKVAELVTDAATAQATGAVVPEVPAGKTATQLEVAPVFTTTVGTEILIPDNRYNITIAANNGRRTDVYVNNQMVVNNLNQGDDGWNPARVLPANNTYSVSDVVIAEGYAKFNYQDHQGDSVDSIQVSKAPEIVARAQRVYVVGDSLVATYYGSTGTEANDKLARTGWGQVIGNYLKNVEVTNLGNSGAWATAMINDAYTNIAASAQPGDIVIWESGYNDTKHGGKEPMKAAIKIAIDECKAKGITFYLVNPNASNHDYKESPESSEGIRELAKETNTPLIDLSKKSYEFFKAHYGDDKALLRPTYNNDADNGLHSSCNAANVFASIVAQGLYDAGETDIVDTEYTYTFTDTKTTPETFNIKVTPSAE